MKRTLAVWIGLWLATCAVTACGTQPASIPSVAHAAVEEAAIVVTRTPLPSWTPPKPAPSTTPLLLPNTTATRTPSPTPITCAETRGEVFTTTIPSKTLRYPIDARIYLPPCYDFEAAVRYPVLYLIHGLNFKEDQWERLGATTIADHLIVEGTIAPLIIVMPRDRKDDRLNRAFVNDLVPYVDDTYRTLAAREFRAIGGLSRGAGWAVHIGLEFPAVFGRIGAHSPAIFYGDEGDLIRWTWHLPKNQKPEMYVDIGEGDSLVHSAAWLDQVLTYATIPHTYIVQDGAHSEKYWAEHVADYLKFYAADWLTTALPTPTPDPAEQQLSP